MRILTTFLVAMTFVVLSGCQTKEGGRAASQEYNDRAKQAQGDSTSQPQSGLVAGNQALSAALVTSTGGRDEQASLSQAISEQTAAAAADRKIIRNGDLTIETESPAEGQRKITSIAESHGGFVVTSEFKHNDGNGQAKPSQTVTVVVRVPFAQFAATLDQIRGVGSRVVQEKVTGQDVSEEYFDLEARIRTKKALEAQFLEIMKQARKVSDALEVQTQLADVRTEIERFEGRRRFLDNQSALSTITSTLQMPMPLVTASTTGFGHSVKQAFGDAVDVAASIVLFVVQAVIVLTPVAFLIVLPVWFIWRVLRRRSELTKEPEPVAESQ
ncbi:MAG TPA: DUF4349 domain-containing protein [Blastocatellia bacterium]|nr:DUF4349 domain-containing protein [Blastocatellia bacterium]